MKHSHSKTHNSEAEAFLSDSSEDSGGKHVTEINYRNRRTQKLHIVVLYATNVALLSALIWSLAIQRKPPIHGFYSPVNSIVKYKDVVFFDNVYDTSPFQGPPDDFKDDLWDKLYRNTSTTVVDAESARRLPNRTMVVPGTDGDGIISLEVFHQLHCLNSLRKSLYPVRFPDYAVYFANGTRKLDISLHHDHCVDRIRQAIICASDLGATYWTWSERLNKWHINMKTTHTCRNFDDIRQWAVARNLADWDQSIPSRLTE